MGFEAALRHNYQSLGDSLKRLPPTNQVLHPVHTWLPLVSRCNLVVRILDWRGRLLSVIRTADLSSFVGAIIRFYPPNLSLGHCLCFQYEVVSDHVVRATGIAPVADRRPQRYLAAIALDGPFRRRQWRHHFLTASAATLMNSCAVSLADVEHAFFEALRDELDGFRSDLFDLHGAGGSVFRCASGRRSQSNRCGGAVASGRGKRCSASSTVGLRGRH